MIVITYISYAAEKIKNTKNDIKQEDINGKKNDNKQGMANN